jgi:site-specific DNA-methyltransferase (adenine-specific)
MTVYEGNGWKVINGRWQDSPPEQVDHVISDPPYDERTHKNGRRGSGPKGGRLTVISESAPKSFPPVDPAEIAPELVNRSRRWVVLFCAVEQLGRYQDASGAAWIRGGVAVKSNPTPQFTGDRPGQGCDGVAIMHRAGRKRWNGGGLPATWNWYTERTDERFHETQKPLEIMTQLIELFTDPGDLIWDPYGGSMTTGVACLMLGRKFIGHEMQERYAEVGAERLRAAEQGLTLSAARAGQIPLFGVAK